MAGLRSHSQPRPATEPQEFFEDTGARTTHGRTVRYAKGKFLGKGGFAKCYECVQMDTKQVFAIKVVSKANVQKPRAYAKLQSEIAIHRTLSHERVVKMFTYFQDAEAHYIVLELCPSQTLNDLLRRRRRFSEAEALYYMYDLMQGVKYLHRHRVLHRDLKLGNLFLDEQYKLKIGDFGLAAQLEYEHEKKRTICGTPNYIAPEILEGKTGHSYEVDIWSIGVILYTCLYGRPPFETSDVKQTYRRIRHAQYTFPDYPVVSTAARSLISSILQVDPRRRPTLDQIFASSWFSASPLPPTAPAAATPRPMSARSDTPARSHEFARIDSPAPSQMRSERAPSPHVRPDTPKVFGSRDRQPPLPSTRSRPPIRSPQRRPTDENLGVEPVPAQQGLERALLERPQNNMLPAEKLTSTGSTDYRPSSTTLRRNPTPPATRRCVSHEAPGLTPKAASPRTAALRLTPRSRVSPRGTPRLAESRTPMRASSPAGAATPLHLLDALGVVLSPRERSGRARSRPVTEVRDVFVQQWMDYTCKYGVGYILSDGSSGVWFNDSTKVVQPKNGVTFDYMTRRLHDTPEQKSTYSMSSYPPDIHKKATLLKHFNNYMHTSEKKEGVTTGRSNLQIVSDSSGQQTYVKKWMRTRHAVLFQLNNKAVQVQFVGDETELLFSVRHHAVTYVDKRKDRHTYALHSVNDVQNPEMTKRLRYVKDMLQNLNGGEKRR